MSRRVLVTLPNDATATHCGSCRHIDVDTAGRNVACTVYRTNLYLANGFELRSRVCRDSEQRPYVQLTVEQADVLRRMLAANHESLPFDQYVDILNALTNYVRTETT